MSQIEITPALLAELKRKAKAVTQESVGLWDLIHAQHTGGWGLCVRDRDSIVTRMTGRNQNRKQMIAEHIAAADPATVLALVAEIERLRAMERRWHKLLTNAQPGPECIGQGFEVKAINKESEAAGE